MVTDFWKTFYNSLSYASCSVYIQLNKLHENFPQKSFKLSLKMSNVFLNSSSDLF